MLDPIYILNQLADSCGVTEVDVMAVLCNAAVYLMNDHRFYAGEPSSMALLLKGIGIQ